MKMVNMNIRRRLTIDRRKRAEDVGSKAEDLIRSGKTAEAWKSIRGWYRSSSGPQQRPSVEDIHHHTKEFQELYIGEEMDDFLGNILMAEGMGWSVYDGRLYEIFYVDED